MNATTELVATIERDRERAISKDRLARALRGTPAAS